jgi:hypothetical protein
MTKIQTIKITNFKAIEDLEADFNGCTAIITGGNNKGKTSFLRGIPDRIRFVRPEVMVKKGATEGKGELTLTSGEKFVWDFGTDGRDKLTYITSEGARRSVTKDLGAQFFPATFDIDKFLQSSPKEQAKQLQAIIGLDFTEIDRRYQKAYDLRTERNREAELYRVKLEKLIKAPHVDPVDITELVAKKETEKKKLNDLYLENKKANEKTRADYNKEKDSVLILASQCERCFIALDTLTKSGYKGDAFDFVDGLKKAIPEVKEPTYIEEMPDRSKLDEIDKLILSANETNAAALRYKEYIDHKNATESARSAADEADVAVKMIERERLDLIASKKMPEGIEITTDGITVDGLPLDRNQISTSKLYTSALKIASINLGEVRTLYFDASFLDKITLGDIQKWAVDNDLQLLIERPDYDGGDIKYELIEQ